MVDFARTKYVRFELRNAEDVTGERKAAIALATDGGPDMTRGVGYQFDEGLKGAISAAMTLGRPLLVTGEPGSGKTELGYAIARNLPDTPKVRHFVCRSASEVNDLFYSYDALARFHAAQLGAGGGSAKASPFIRYTALGRALLDAWGADTVADFRPGKRRRQGQRSVLIIDEIDKASRDFCNDLLDQLETLSFSVPELFAEVADPKTPPGAVLTQDLRPVVVIASNSEKLLPEPFLRRCVYYPIEPAAPEMLRVIIEERIIREFGATENLRIRQAAVRIQTIFETVAGLNLSKKPGTAELIDATLLVAAFILEFGKAPDQLDEFVLPVLVKDVSDVGLARNHLAVRVKGR